jgi:orotidine-5'-phosphate decarboxylase
MNFVSRLEKAITERKSLVCLGLDPDPALMPKVSIAEFNKAIIEATSDLVCAYKPNLAFYESLGIDGLVALQKTVEYIPRDVPVIGDAKRGDIGNTAKQYAKAMFETFGFDAVTVNPYLGRDSVEPFLSYREKGVFVLCRTSNPGAEDFQSLLCASPGKVEGKPLFAIVAAKAKEWNLNGNVGLVAGATYPEELKQIRALCPDMPLLIPGIGTQEGDLALALRYGIDAKGKRTIFASSRQILYASKGKDFAQAARQAADKLRTTINSLLKTAQP